MSEIKKGDMVKYDGRFHGKVDSIVRTQDGEIVAYYIIPVDKEDGIWVDYDNIVLY